MSSFLHRALQKVSAKEVTNFSDNIWLWEKRHSTPHEMLIDLAVHCRLGQRKKEGRTQNIAKLTVVPDKV